MFALKYLNFRVFVLDLYKLFLSIQVPIRVTVLILILMLDSSSSKEDNLISKYLARHLDLNHSDVFILQGGTGTSDSDTSSSSPFSQNDISDILRMGTYQVSLKGVGFDSNVAGNYSINKYEAHRILVHMRLKWKRDNVQEDDDDDDDDDDQYQDQGFISTYKYITVMEIEIQKFIENVRNQLTNGVDAHFLWKHLILEIPRIQLRIRESIGWRFENISKNFQLDSKLRVLLRPSENENELLELYSIKDIRFVERRNFSSLYSYGGGKIDFRGAVIRATAVDTVEQKEVVLYDEESPVPKFIGGLGVSDLWDIRDILNFTVLAMSGDDFEANATNGFLPTGFGRQLLDGEADVSIIHTYHLVENLHYLTPLVAMGEDRVWAIFRQPPSSAVRNAFSKPFSRDAWLLISLTWIIIILSVTLFRYVIVTLMKNPTELWNKVETLLWAIAIFCQRSYFWQPSSTPLRLVFLYSLLWSLSIYSIYSAQIISSFTAEFLPIRSVVDLITNKFKLISNPDYFFSYFLLQAGESRFELEEKLRQVYPGGLQSISELSEGFKMTLHTLDTLFVFAKELGYSDRETCSTFHYIPLGSVTLKSGFFVPKNSPLKEPFNLKLIWIMEKGLNNRYIRRYYENTMIKCPKVVTRYRQDLGLPDVLTAFIILLMGISLALSLLAFEIFRKYRRKLK